MTTIFHNPRCGKSRQTLSILTEKKESIEIVEYLKTPISTERLKEILEMLGISPKDLIRKGEKIFKEKFKNITLSDDEWIKVMTEHPILIERPIVIKNGKAIVGRPPENVLTII